MILSKKIIHSLISTFLLCCILAHMPGDQSLIQIRILKETKDTVYIEVPKDFSFENAREWSSIGHYLVSTDKKDYILLWQGYGGEVVIGHHLESFITQAERQGKEITIDLIGGAYSMHGNAACFASRIIFEERAFLMYHADSLDDTYVSTRATTEIQEDLDMCVAKGILRKEDVDTLWKGYEVYRYKDKVVYVQDPRLTLKRTNW